MFLPVESHQMEFLLVLPQQLIDFSIKEKDKRHIDLDLTEFMTKVAMKTGYNPQLILKAFSDIFEEIETSK